MVTEATRRHFPAGAVVALGLFFTASLSLHVVSHESPTVVTLGLAVLLVVFALAIVGFGIRLLASPDSTEESWRIVGWAVAGSLAVSALGAVLFAHLDAWGVLSGEILFFATATGTSGAAVGLVVGAVDRRSRRRARELGESESQFRSVFENTLDALVLADDDGRYVAANPAATELFGVDHETLLGNRIEDFAAPEFDFESAWADFQDGSGDRGVFPLQRPDGKVRLVEFSATRDVYPGAHLSALRDVTERERSQQLVASQHEQLAFLNRMLRHHVRNNLQVVVAEADRLDAAGDASAGVLLERIDAIEALLDSVGRFTSSLTRDEPLHTVHLDGVLSEARESVVASTPGVTIEIDDLPETGVVADGLLTDVFENILNNAVQHNDDGTSHIHVTNATDDESVTITVADDGPGIADDRKQRIFEWTDGPTADLGFGLYLTKALVQRYGGRIWIEESTELGGAAFSVELRRDLHEVLSARRKLDVSSL